MSSLRRRDRPRRSDGRRPARRTARRCRPTPPTPNTTTDSPIFTLASLLMTPGRGGHRAAEQRRDLEVEVGRDHRHAVLRDDGVVVEGRDPAGVELARRASGRRGVAALDALARPPVQHHGVARLDVASRPGRSRRTVAEASCPSRCGRNLSGPLAASISLICAPQIVVCRTLHQHLADVERVGQVDLVDDQRLARLREDRGLGCLDLHRGSAHSK